MKETYAQSLCSAAGFFVYQLAAGCFSFFQCGCHVIHGKCQMVHAAAVLLVNAGRDVRRWIGSVR